MDPKQPLLGWKAGTHHSPPHHRRVSFRFFLCASTFFALALYTILSGLYVFPRLSSARPRNSAIRDPTHSLNNTIVPSWPPGVGFNLTPTYGTATIRLFPNTTIHIGPIPGSTEYNNTMHKLSLESSKHTAPPYNWWYDPPGGVFAGYYDVPRELKRRLRKRLGLPATPEVGTLAEMFTVLREDVEMKLGRRIGEVVVTTANIVALYDEDLYDAAEFTGLTLLTNKRFARQPRHRDAAIVGYGLGVCKSFTCPRECAAEEHELPERSALSILFTRAALSIECRGRRKIAETHIPYWQQHPSNFHEDLGLEAYERLTWGPDSRRLFWARVRYAVDEAAVSRCYSNNVTDVLLFGEAADNEMLKKVALEAVMARRGEQVEEPRFWLKEGDERLFVASMGAAEMAVRILAEHAPCEG